MLRLHGEPSFRLQRADVLSPHLAKRELENSGVSFIMTLVLFTAAPNS